ncbi:uncharacterized protein LOC125155043 [Prionailurus viverrinus]|uniref:uncharacterized protein LOC125155043 n=1 Tax=Prionailurus viverrinus TaxID=61388 RepID=UPI001FF6CF67|nr:uncharacterized protein LOC125155043 [Prionailurus viverrinus]
MAQRTMPLLPASCFSDAQKNVWLDKYSPSDYRINCNLQEERRQQSSEHPVNVPRSDGGDPSPAGNGGHMLAGAAAQHLRGLRNQCTPVDVNVLASNNKQHGEEGNKPKERKERGQQSRKEEPVSHKGRVKPGEQNIKPRMRSQLCKPKGTIYLDTPVTKLVFKLRAIHSPKVDALPNPNHLTLQNISVNYNAIATAFKRSLNSTRRWSENGAAE